MTVVVKEEGKELEMRERESMDSASQPGGKEVEKREHHEGVTHVIHRSTFIVMILVCAIDGIDIQLLPSTYKSLETELGFGPKLLGMLSMGQGLFQAVSAMVWGALIDRGLSRKKLITIACFGWGSMTILLALASNFYLMFILRCFNGMALAALGPISQSVIADVVPYNSRGKAFGLVQFAKDFGKAIAALVVTAVANLTVTMVGGVVVSGWRFTFWVVGIISILLCGIIHRFMIEPQHVSEPERMVEAKQVDEEVGVEQGKPKTLYSEFVHEVRYLGSFFKIRSFVVILLQGIFGSIPWACMSFTILWLQYQGISDAKAGTIAMSVILSCALGGVIGGAIGDVMHKWSQFHGRPITAKVSVLSGIVLFCLMFLEVPKGPQSFGSYLVLGTLFGLTGSWAGVSCNSPLLLDLVEPRSRARIIGLLISIEGAFAAMLGAPVVGALAESLGYIPVAAGTQIEDLPNAERERNLDTLTTALSGCILIPWVLCFCFFTLLHCTYKRDVMRVRGNV